MFFSWVIFDKTICAQSPVGRVRGYAPGYSRRIRPSAKRNDVRGNARLGVFHTASASLTHREGSNSSIDSGE